MHKDWEIHNSYIVTEDSVSKGKIRIKNESIHSINENPSPDIPTNSPILDLEGTCTYPGLINAHDHLIGSYSPAVLNGSPYLSWLAWDNTLKSSLVFSERQTLDPMDLYLLGAYKNIFGGTTTVMDHIPHFLGASYRERTPIRILSQYRLSHSIGTYSLGWGDGPSLEYAEAEKRNIPYITHLGEGIDDESKDSLRLLEKLGGLGEFSVIIHGIPFGSKEIQKIKNSKANMVWCPCSNHNLFRKQPPIASFLDAGIPVSLGTDLALTGSGSMFNEMKHARQYFKESFGRELGYKEIFVMATSNPARALRVDSKLGKISRGNKADLLVLRSRKDDPYENLVESDWEDIVLLTRDGSPILLDEKLEGFSIESGLAMKKIQSKSGVRKLISGDPHLLLKKIQSILGYKKDLAFLPIFESIDNEA